MLKQISQWLTVLMGCGVKKDTAARWAPVFAEVVREDSFNKRDSELDDFLGQILHESSHLERMEEGLSYSAERLMAVWPKRFPTLEAATPYARNPVALANKVYGGRLGNTGPGDGYKYRGRGLLQVTGYANYAAVAEVLRLDLVGNPDLMAQPKVALLSAIAWWEKNIPDSVIGDVERESRLVNGGTVGLAERRALTEAAAKALA